MILRELIRQLVDLNNADLRVVIRCETVIDTTGSNEDFSIKKVKMDVTHDNIQEIVAVIEID